MMDPESNTAATAENRSGPIAGVIDAANVQFAKGVDAVRSAIHVPAAVMAYPLKQAPEVQQMERTVSNLIRASAALFLFVCGNIDSFSIIGAIFLVASLHVFWRSAAGLSTAAIYAKRFRMIGGFILFISVWSLIIKLGMGVGGAPHALSHVDEAVSACKATPAPQLHSCGHVEKFARVFMNEMSRRSTIAEHDASFANPLIDPAYFAAVDYMTPMHSEHMQGPMVPPHHQYMHGHSDDDDDKALHGHKEKDDDDDHAATPPSTHGDFMKWLLEHKRHETPADGAAPELPAEAAPAAHVMEWRAEFESKALHVRSKEGEAAATVISNSMDEPNATSSSVAVEAPIVCVTDRRVGRMAAESLFVASASMIRCEHLPTWESKCEAVGRFIKTSAWWLLAAIVLYQVGCAADAQASPTALACHAPAHSELVWLFRFAQGAACTACTSRLPPRSVDVSPCMQRDSCPCVSRRQVLAAALVFKYASRLVKLSHVEA